MQLAGAITSQLATIKQVTSNHVSTRSLVQPPTLITVTACVMTKHGIKQYGFMLEVGGRHLHKGIPVLTSSGGNSRTPPPLCMKP